MNYISSWEMVRINKYLLRLENIVFLGICLYLYSYNNLSWILLIVFLLSPDISMVGYMVNKKVGAITYNVVHTYFLSIPTLLLGLHFDSNIIIMIGLIWTIHIALDRVLGYGLKLETDFKHTHLNS